MEALVSICMNTFQHENFIGKAIEGVLMQRTNFPFEILIGEDSSTDCTRVICEEYAEKYPGKIKILPNHKKYGQNANISRTIAACTGKYIALCEGDDFWIDPYKLQKQVDFLEQHEDFVMCFHKINSVDEQGNILEDVGGTNETIFYNGNDFFHVFIPTPAIVFRNCIKSFPEEFYSVKSTDAFLFAMLSGYGKGADLGFIGASYRKHAGGFYNRLSPLGRYKQSIHTRKIMKRSDFFNPEQKKEIRRELVRRERLYIKYFLKKMEIVNCFKIISFYISLR